MTNCQSFNIVAAKTPKTITFTYLWGIAQLLHLPAR